MKTILHNMKTKIAATAITILSFGAVNAQTCAVSGIPTYNNNGNLSMMAQASFTSGWNSYYSVDFGDGGYYSDANVNFFNTSHTYAQNGWYLITTTLTAYDPLDSNAYCTISDYDTLVITDLSNPVNPTCQASFFLWQDSTNVLGNGWLATNNSSGSGALTYSWDFGDGATSTQAYPMHTYNTPGNYIICLTISDSSCTSTTCDSSAALRMMQGNLSTNAIIGSLTVSAPTGISEHNSNSVSVNVAPNPMAANTKVNFESTTSLKGKIEIVNVLGAVTFSETIQIVNGNNSFNINTENIASGIYFLKITSENKTLSTVKVVK